MHLPLVVSDIDTDDDNSSNNIKENNDFKITQTQHRLVVLTAALVVIGTIIALGWTVVTRTATSHVAIRKNTSST